MDYYIELKDVSKKVKENYILKDINLKIKKGEIVGIIGLNGCGKTTLLKCILGFNKYDGEVLIDGKKDNVNKLYNSGFIIENPNLYLNLSGKKNLDFWIKFYKNIHRDYVNSLCNMFQLNLNKKVKKYSLGMKQKLGIVISLLNKPKLLILDEPTNGLDFKNIINLRNLLLKLVDSTILISSHDINELCNICDKLVLINKGQIVKVIKKSNFIVNYENELIKLLENDYV